MTAPHPPRIPGYEHLDVQSLIAGCVALLEGRPWRIEQVCPIYLRDRPLHVTVHAWRWAPGAPVRRHFLLPWGTPCPVRLADAP